MFQVSTRKPKLVYPLHERIISLSEGKFYFSDF